MRKPRTPLVPPQMPEAAVLGVSTKDGIVSQSCTTVGGISAPATKGSSPERGTTADGGLTPGEREFVRAVARIQVRALLATRESSGEGR